MSKMAVCEMSAPLISDVRIHVFLAMLCSVITWSFCTPDHDPWMTRTTLTIFDEINSGMPLAMYQILEVDELVCGGTHKNAACQECYRDGLCPVYHDCCPDVLLKENVNYTSHPMECLSTTPFPVRGKRYKVKDHNQMMVSRCPVPMNMTQYTGPLEREPAKIRINDDTAKCHNPDVTNFDQSTPVVSLTSGLMYKNKYCAACHGHQTNLTQWEISISCLGRPAKLFSTAKSKSELFQILMSADGVQSVGCELQFVPPENVKTLQRPCTYVAPRVISSCNVTKEWKIYDDRLEKACASYTSIFMNQYKNIFCYMCNIKQQMTLDDLRNMSMRAVPFVGVAGLGYSALLDLNDQRSVPIHDAVAPRCSSNQFYDTVQCTCRPTSCSEGKFLSNTGTCLGILNSNFLGYRVCGHLHIETESPVIDLYPGPIWVKLLKSTAVRQANMSLIHWCPGEKRISFYISLLAIGDEHKPPGQGLSTLEELEGDVHDILLGNLSVFTEQVLNTSLHHVEFVSVHPCLEIRPETFPCPGNTSIVFPTLQNASLQDQGTGEERTYFIHYHKVATCPFVDMPLASLALDSQKQRYVYADTNRSIAVSEVTTINQSTVWICVSDYKILTETDFPNCITKAYFTDARTAVGLISVICTCISLICLLITFIVLIILPPLRTGLGKNIITLIVTLFMAQAFYEFAIEQYENVVACKVFGILIHYTWLAAMFSTNVCTFERFYKLYFPFKSRVFFMAEKPFIVGTAYTFICPSIIVSANCVVNMLARDNIGYGSPRLCYINTLVSRIVTFAIPLAIIVFVNLCLLVTTIYKVNKESRREDISTFQMKLGIMACVRLSSVTGLTWFLAFLYEAIPSQVLEYIITALMGLQGVLFFVTIVLNHRVLDLLMAAHPTCLAICGCQKSRMPHSHSSHTQSTSLAGTHDHTVMEKTALQQSPLVAKL